MSSRHALARSIPASKDLAARLALPADLQEHAGRTIGSLGLDHLEVYALELWLREVCPSGGVAPELDLHSATVADLHYWVTGWDL